MKQFPSIPRVKEAPPELLDGGHLWLQERIDGAHLRFQLRDSGLLRFGDRTRVFDTDEIPEPYRHAVRYVRERFDRQALRDTLDDVESVTFSGVATHRHAIDYDWDRLPSFLGVDVWSDAKGRFLAPDAAEGIYDRLGLRAVNAFEKEVRAVDFDPDSYEIPESAWYDGPAKGTVLRNKTGQRGKLLRPTFWDEDGGSTPAATDSSVEMSAEELARAHATDDRFESVVRKLEAEERSVTFDAVFERVVEGVFREEHHRLFGDGRTVDVQEFRSEVAARTQQVLEGE